MANYTFRHKTTAAWNLYCKAMPQVVSPWSTGTVDMSEGPAGEYSCTLDSNTEYVMYRRVGGSKLSTDPDEAIIPKNLDIDILAQLAFLGAGGSETVRLSVRDNGAAIPGASVYITSDLPGANIVISGLVSNAAGDVTCRLNPGTYYAWISHPSYTATNPQTIVVTDA